MSEKGMSFEFENLALENLDEMLRRFCASLRTSKGELCSKRAFVAITDSINFPLYTVANPYYSTAQIVTSNMFNSMLKKSERRN
jgi:hypothetical protein